MGFEDIKYQANEFLEQVQEYFAGCSQNELIAWGAITLGVILIIIGLFMIIF